MELFNFKTSIVKEHSNIKTTFLGKPLILVDVTYYNGPITLQYLPFGGIQSTYNYQLIINTKKGFITPSLIVYDNEEMDVKSFVIKYPNLVNQVLPN